MADGAEFENLLPTGFARWFDGRGWRLRAHQAAMIEAARAGRSTLLVAPTGGGKTLAGFLPSLIELSGAAPPDGLHTLYLSPLKALAVDIARNVDEPVAEMGLPIRIETRTGDTPPAKRQRQRRDPPHMLLTTPEQLALLLAHPDAETFFSSLRAIVLDELHALAASKRGDLLSLCLARLRHLAPEMRAVGLSATVRDPAPLQRFLVGRDDEAGLVTGGAAAAAEVDILQTAERIPWSGHSARHAYGEIYKAIGTAQTALIFTNTRSQAEATFSALWAMNNDNLAIALHHGSLDRERRRKVEAAMARGDLRAVVCTSTLDLGIDWGAVDLVIQIGAPKGSARLVQRIGRSNHRLDEPSRAVLAPANRFEVLECRAAIDAVRAGALDGEAPRRGGLDVLCQHIVGMACAAPFSADDLYKEVISSAPYDDLPRETFDKALAFVSDGGYALKAYDRYKRIVKTPEGLHKIRNAHFAQRYRLNMGTIVEAPAVTVRLGRKRKGADGRPMGPGARMGRKLGTLEEWFIEQLAPGDTFLFAGEVLRFEGMSGTDALASRASGDPKVPMWGGGKFPLSTFLAARVREMIADPARWSGLPEQVRDWLAQQQKFSVLPAPDNVLVETFARSDKHYLVCYPFDGRLAHQSLGMLLTRRLERLGLQPLGFCPTEYALSVWARKDLSGIDMAALFDEDMLGDDLESWLAEAALMKRTFRDCAVIAGLIERNHPGEEKSSRQIAFSSDLIYDVLKEHEPDHVLLEAAWADAAGGFLDLGRLAGLLRRAKGAIRHQALSRVSPLAVPVMLEIGRETIYGEASEAILADFAKAVIEEAGAGP